MKKIGAYYSNKGFYWKSIKYVNYPGKYRNAN